jgi:hypothetical protein
MLTLESPRLLFREVMADDLPVLLPVYLSNPAFATMNEVSASIGQLKMTTADGKQRATDAADSETLLRIIQSVPSPKAEPVKEWLARVGAKRLEDVTQPLPASEAATTIVAVPKPAESAPALEQICKRLDRRAASSGVPA